MSFKCLSADPLAHISIYLCWLDILAWRCSNKHVSQQLKQPSFRLLLEQYLESVGINGKKFVRSAVCTGTYISGGTILKVMLGLQTGWGNGDIDVYKLGVCDKGWMNDWSFLIMWNPIWDYVADRSDVPFPDNLTNRCTKLEKQAGMVKDAYIYRRETDESTDILDDMMQIATRNIEGLRDNRPIQPIRYSFGKRDSPIIEMDYVMVNPELKGATNLIDMFDISICKNAFGRKVGTTCECKRSNECKCSDFLYIRHLDHLFAREFTSIIKTEYQIRIAGRYDRPGHREEWVSGSKIKSRKKHDHMAEKWEARIKKYESRGFSCIERKISTSTVNS